MIEPGEHLDWRTWRRLIQYSKFLNRIQIFDTAIEGLPELDRWMNHETMFVLNEDQVARYSVDLVKKIGVACGFAASEWTRTRRFLAKFVRQCMSSNLPLPFVATVIPVRGLKHVHWKKDSLWIEAKEWPAIEISRLADMNRLEVGFHGIERGSGFMELGTASILPRPGSDARQNRLWQFTYDRTVHYGNEFGSIAPVRLPETWIYPGEPDEFPGVRLPHWIARRDPKLQIIHGPVITFCRFYGPSFQRLSFVCFDLDEKSGDILNVRLGGRIWLREYLLADPNNHVALHGLLNNCRGF